MEKTKCGKMKALAALAVACLAFGSIAGNIIRVGPKGDVGTLDEARDKVRAIKAANGGKVPDGGVVVEVADGSWRMAAPLSLDRRDSGRDGATVRWRAANRGKAVLCGFAPLEHLDKMPEDREALLRPEARGHVSAWRVPGSEPIPGFRGGGNIRQTRTKQSEDSLALFVDGERLQPARWPNDEFVKTGVCMGDDKYRDHTGWHWKSGAFEFDSPRLETWKREPDLWANGLWVYEWADLRTPVTNVDVTARTLAVDPDMSPYGFKPDRNFFIFNAISEIDRPGEWALDRANRAVYMWMPDGTSGGPCHPSAKNLLTISNATDIVFEGFVFEGAAADAVRMEGARNISLEANVIRHTGTWAVKAISCRNVAVTGCDMYDLGEGGVHLHGGDINTLEPGGNSADNCHISHYGRVTPNYRPGVQLLGVGNSATHNLIHHARHQGIAFGGNDHRIAWNILHDLCQFNDDAGSIYCCQRDWTKRGTVIEHNLVHMTGKLPRPTHTEAIYLDDCSSGVTVRGNILSRASMGVYIGGGNDCTVTNNLVINCFDPVRIGSRGIESFAGPAWSSKGRESPIFKAMLKRIDTVTNDMWKVKYPRLAKVLDFEDACYAHNAHWNTVGRNVYVSCGEQQVQNAANIEGTTLLTNITCKADPGFVDYFAFDWRLKKGTDAERMLGDLGFERMGLYPDSRRASPSVRFGKEFTPPRPLRREYAAPAARIDIVTPENLPQGVEQVAKDCVKCEVPTWSRGKRIMASSSITGTEWKILSFSFTPNITGRMNMEIMGAMGDKTAYDAISVEGAEFADGGFETGKGWRQGLPNQHSKAAANLAPPFGITGAQKGLEPFEGSRLALANHEIRVSRMIAVTSGVPVKVSYVARPFIED